jgi:hypothetical protein
MTFRWKISNVPLIEFEDENEDGKDASKQNRPDRVGLWSLSKEPIVLELVLVLDLFEARRDFLAYASKTFRTATRSKIEFEDEDDDGNRSSAIFVFAAFGFSQVGSLGGRPLKQTFLGGC